MPGFPSDLLERLKTAPVSRNDISSSLVTTSSVSMALAVQARLLTPPHVVERHLKGGEISYSLRPVRAGEIAGQVKEAMTLTK